MRPTYQAADATPASREQAAPTNTPTTADADRLLQEQPGFFLPNLGQWDHPAQVAAHPPMELPDHGTFAIFIQGGIHHGLWQR